MTQSIEMINLDLELRYAHIDGHTELDFIPGKNQLITAGVDCEVRIWSLDLDANDEVQSSFAVEDVPYSILATNDRAYVALASNSVKSFQLDEPVGEDETLVCRFTSNATCLSFHPNRELLAIGAADFNIKLVNLVDQTNKSFEGHEGPILSLSLDPLRKYLVSSSCDGSIILWALESRTIQHKWLKIFPKSNDFENSPTLCRICWEPQFGEFLAIPRKTSVELYKRGQWDRIPVHQVKYPEISDDDLVSIVCFSADSQLLAASTIKSVVAIWKMDHILLENSSHPVAMLYNMGNRITCLKFNPIDSNQLCCTDNGGSLRIMKIKGKTTINTKSQSITTTIQEKTKVQNQAIGQKTMDDILANFFDDDDDFCFSVEDSNNKNRKTNENILGESLLLTKTSNISPEKNDRSSIIIDTQQQVEDLQVELDEKEFDISAIKSKYEPLIFGDGDDHPDLEKQTSHKFNLNSELVIDGYRITGNDLLQMSRNTRNYQPPIRQQPFQSGSTPTHYQNRFMVWNSVGIIYSYNSEEERSIDVEFHDLTFHHSIHMANMYNYTIADLSSACLLLASNGDDNESEDPMDHLKARMFCLLFNTWDQMKEWQVDLPKDEFFDCITAGQTFVATLTSLRYLRVWTIGGIQTMIRSIDGASINLSSYDHLLMVLYHSAIQHSEDGQSIGCLVLKVDHKGKTRAHPIPTPVPVSLSPKATVYWAGFTDEGTPCIVDSDGIIRVYKNHFGTGWFPICATKKHANGKSDNFFIIGLSEIQAQVRCIFCKASRYPDTVPKPTLTILPLQIPLCELGDFTENAKSKHEEECLRSRWLASLLKKLSLDDYDVEDSLDQTEKQIINSLIKLFALALGAERESLALEVAKLLPNSQALEGAVRYAERQRHRSLAMKLVEMIQEGDDQQEQEKDELDSDLELQDLMTKKKADHLRQILKENGEIGDNQSGGSKHHNMISLTKCHQTDLLVSKSFTSLKPKSMNKSSNDICSVEPITVDLNDTDDEENENHDDIQLRPKNFQISSSNQRNPFKIQNSNLNRKRKQIEESDDDEIVEQDSDNDDEENENEKCPTEDLESDKGFICYFEENRIQLFEDNQDEIETEEDLVELMKKKYGELSSKERAKWMNKALRLDSKKKLKKRSKATTSTYQITSDDENKTSKTVKITNFFIKKT